MTVGDRSSSTSPGTERADEKDVTVTTPDDRAEKIQHAGSRRGRALWRWTDTDVSGVYRAAIGQHPQRAPVRRQRARRRPTGQQAGESDLSADDAGGDCRSSIPSGTSRSSPTRRRSQARREASSRPPATRSTAAAGSAIARWLLLWRAGRCWWSRVVLAWHFGHYSAVHDRDAAERLRPAGTLGVLVAGRCVGAVVGLLLAFVLATGRRADPRGGDRRLPRLPAGSAAARRRGGDGRPAAGRRRGQPLAPGVPRPTSSTAGRPRGSSAAAGRRGCVGLVVILLYRREGSRRWARPRRRPRRGPGWCCRPALGLVLLMLAVFLPQLRLWFERQGWPDVVHPDRRLGEHGRGRRVPRPATVKEAAERLADGRRPGQGRAAPASRRPCSTRGDADWLDAAA